MPERNTFEENLINWIIKKAEGRLTVYKPEEDGVAADLVIKKKARYKGSVLNLRVKSTDKLEEGDMFVVDVLKEGFSPEINFYLIFAYFDPIEQKINDYIWLIPSTEFNKLAEEVDKDAYQPRLRFKALLDVKKRNQYSSFLIYKKDLVEILLDIVENPEKFKFAQAPTIEARTINLQNLKDFIAEARGNTYAGGGREVDNPRLSGSTQLEYQKANYFYRDIYFDGTPHFIGQEVVYINNKPVWSMVYIGQDTPKDVTKFLKKALSKLSQECRFGGSCEYEEEIYKYQDGGQGTLENFSGEETISKSEEQVYRLSYMGGLIAKET